MLSIQKAVLLLDEFHLAEFKRHLEESRAELPLRLVDATLKIGWEENDSDDLCKAIYKKAEPQEKRKFFQLAHHTFKLTGFLSRNYPSYLLHNISRIEKLINEGKQKEAFRLAEVLLDVSEKTEDYTTAKSVLRFLAQHSYMREKKSEAVRYLQRNAQLIDNERALNSIYLYMRSHLHFKDKSTTTEGETEKHLSFFAQFHGSESFAVRILGRYGSCYTLHFLNDDRFYSKETLDELNALVDELEKAPYVIFSFSDDIELNIEYLKLKLLVGWLNPDELQKAAAEILRKRETPGFWKNYINGAQIAFLSIQASVLVSRYAKGYRKNWNEDLPADIREQVSFYRKACEEILSHPSWE
ncbi:MAG TPA: hypothetical protein VFU15_06570, partial [Bacteroidia bacterium]|nr:hypothetical protein [Bacteroidia bacterium]